MLIHSTQTDGSGPKASRLISISAHSARVLVSVLGSSESSCALQLSQQGNIWNSVAHAEVTMLLAYLFRKFDMVLETGKLDVQDYFVSAYKKGVYVKFKPL